MLGIVPNLKDPSIMRLTPSSTPSDIIDYFDSHLTVTLRDISGMTGRSVAYLRGLLMVSA